MLVTTLEVTETVETTHLVASQSPLYKKFNEILMKPEEFLEASSFGARLGGIESFALTELLNHQLTFVIPMLESYRISAPTPLIHSFLETPQTKLFHRTLYGVSGPLTAQGIQLKAMQSKGKWTLNGRLPVTLLCAESDYLLVFAKTAPSNAICAFIVKSQGLKPGHGINIIESNPTDDSGSYSVAELEFNDVLIDNEYQLGLLDVKQADEFITQSRLVAAHTHCVNMRNTLNTTIEFLRQRLSNDKPLLAIESIQHKLADLEAKWTALNAYLKRDPEKSSFAITPARYANTAKYQAITLRQKINQACLHLGGIHYYQAQSPIAKSYRETQWGQILTEPNEVLLTMPSDVTQEQKMSL
jgi:hypothetical protein